MKIIINTFFFYFTLISAIAANYNYCYRKLVQISICFPVYFFNYIFIYLFSYILIYIQMQSEKRIDTFSIY